MTETSLTPPHLVLIHGAGHGAWCWYKIRCLLESSGYNVTCLDLTSAGINNVDPNTVFNFQQYNQPLIDFLFALPEYEKVILVGHSSGGICVTDAMYKFPEKIQVVVYLAAPMLKHGFVTEEDYKMGIADLSEYGDISEYGYGQGPDQPPTSVKMKKEFQREILYFMSPLEVILVGHSAGGLTVTDAMYKFPEKIQVVVYLAAQMLKHGLVTEEDYKLGIPDLSEYGDITESEYGQGPDQPATSIKIKKEFQREIFYFMSPLEDSTLASMCLKPQPTMPFREARFEGNDGDGVPRVYIKTVLDRALKEEQQDGMIQRWPPALVFGVDSDHSPFFSAPLVLSSFLIQIADSF